MFGWFNEHSVIPGTRMLMYFYIFSQENRMHITTIPVYYQVITQNYNHNSRAYLNKTLIEQQNPGLFQKMLRTEIS